MNDTIRKWSAKYEVDPALVYGVMMAESHGIPHVVRYEKNYPWLFNPHGVKPLDCSLATETNLQQISWGCMQVMGATFRELGYRGWLTLLVNDTDRQVQYGVKYLAKQIKRFGSVERGVSAYNAGRPTKENQSYVNRVLNYMREWKQ